MKKSELREIVQRTIQEVRKSIKEVEYVSPQEKIAQRKLEQEKINLARAVQAQAQKNISAIK